MPSEFESSWFIIHNSSPESPLGLMLSGDIAIKKQSRPWFRLSQYCRNDEKENNSRGKEICINITNTFIVILVIIFDIMIDIGVIIPYECYYNYPDVLSHRNTFQVNISAIIRHCVIKSRTNFLWEKNRKTKQKFLYHCAGWRMAKIGLITTDMARISLLFGLKGTLIALLPHKGFHFTKLTFHRIDYLVNIRPGVLLFASCLLRKQSNCTQVFSYLWKHQNHFPLSS